MGLRGCGALAGLALWLAGCGALPGISLPATNAGLSDAEAAHAEVEASAPAAFMLTAAGPAVVDALNQLVEPQRRALARAIQGDATVFQGLAGWDGAATNDRLAVLERVADLEAQAMGVSVPAIAVETAAPPQPGEIAFFQVTGSDNGQITLYASALAAGGAFLALDTLVHEMRHAAQYQLVRSVANDPAARARNDARSTLANAYAAAWLALDPLGGEGNLAYGDYTHLTIEFDAFQTGNEVAALVSNGRFDQLGLGFVDAQFSGAATPLVDLAHLLGAAASVPDLVGAVNAAERQAEQTAAGVAPRGRHRLGRIHAASSGTAGLVGRRGP